jgi:hypothetical protein
MISYQAFIKDCHQASLEPVGGLLLAV